jgi:hypothetical protein
MELAEATKMMGLLEQQYFEMHQRAKEAEAALLATKNEEATPLGALSEARARLDEAEREKRAILAAIERIEGQLLDEA